MIRMMLILLISLAIGACGTDNDDRPSTANADTERTKTTTVESDTDEEPAMSEFLADSLHPIELATPGRFRLEVAGEVHEGQLGSCGWIMRTAEGQNQDRFSATADWRADDGRRLSLELWRVVMHDDFFWNANHGHEIDRVRLRKRTGGDNPVSLMVSVRPRPGDSPRWRWGSGDMPAVRVSADGPRATVVGELQGQETDQGRPLTGPFSLSVHCAAD